MTVMPTGEPQVPDLMKIIRGLQKDIRALQRTHEEEGPRQLAEDRAVFSHPGVPVAGAISPPYIYRRPSGYLTAVIVTARVPGSTASVLTIKRWINKTDTEITVVTVTLTVGYKYVIADDLMEDFDDLDHAMVSLSTVGTGVSDVTAVLEFSEGMD